jgi:hypothetical protein
MVEVQLGEARQHTAGAAAAGHPKWEQLAQQQRVEMAEMDHRLIHHGCRLLVKE